MTTREKTGKGHKIVLLGVLLLMLGMNGDLFAEEKKTDNNTTPDKKLQKRIDFENAYILGQSIKSGAVYLLHRKQSDIKSMLEIRTEYRDEILEDFTYNDLVILHKAGEEKQKQ